MSVVITGGSGFVGRNLVLYLEACDARVKILSRSVLEADRLNLPADARCIVHLAGKAHDLKNAADPSAYYETNFELTKKLYAAFLDSKAEKFIFVSSVKAVADTVRGVLDENCIPNPLTDYGKSKLKAEHYILSQELPPGKAFYILRPCMIHGPGNKGNLNLLYHFVKKRVPYPLAAYENKRSFLSVENLCFIIKELLVQRVSPGIYNVADDDPLSTSDVVKILSQSLNKKAKLWYLSKKLIRSVAKIGDMLKLPLNTERLEKLTENYVVSNSKIKSALNSELPIKTVDGLMITAKSFKY